MKHLAQPSTLDWYVSIDHKKMKGKVNHKGESWNKNHSANSSPWTYGKCIMLGFEASSKWEVTQIAADEIIQIY